MSKVPIESSLSAKFIFTSSCKYGICKFNDTKKIYLDDAYHECLELEFYDNQKLYLPIENLNHITKYSNDENNNIILDKLGSSHWQKRKAEAKNKIRDAAKKLIRIASLRLKSRSYDIDIKNYEYAFMSCIMPLNSRKFKKYMET